MLVEKAVFMDYETFQKNRDNTDIDYAHVDSVNVFQLLDKIVNQHRNNPMYQFEKYIEIEEWLREQWAGLFQEVISRRREQKELASLSERVIELSSLNSTLKTYLEAIISKVSPEQETKELIQSEQDRLDEEKRMREFFNLKVASNLIKYDLSHDGVKEIVGSAKSIKDFLHSVEKVSEGQVNAKRVIESWKKTPTYVDEFNKARSILGKPSLEFMDLSKKSSSKKTSSVKKKKKTR
jgi:hypothetical protein